ncbi:two-component system cell cycle sensor histidine kinase/response regulator CckA [Enterococcus sp. PF1-24]|uniref:sensor histidine kinase n=1 Tax=unclassified Enterococcus TaxID=2608891 RepID=UPI0024756B45|nr:MULTISPECIES: ATP-binding protein [unclassified Enterococcus]MDH6365579.1 two-component system cell cycle sensor histidine kinase/response regulator CckA [Enterococcus sp. PFB1-1]MDH6402681.1 two-component system cell cycle sensor histidine kinase/response regulator CckA [Enterococcus sp. PF1-24]
MNSKPSNKWLNIGLFFISILTGMGILFTAVSYLDAKDHALKMGESQLAKINDYATKVLGLEIQSFNSFLEDYTSEVVKVVRPLNLDKKVYLQQFFAKKKGIAEGVYLLAPNGDLVSGYQYADKELQTINALPTILQEDTYYQQGIKGEVRGNGSEYFLEGDTYLNIYCPLTAETGELLGVLVMPINLETLYLEEIRQRDDELNGYTMVKNQEMKIIIHPAREQIGLTIVADRKERFPNLDFSDLERLETEQLANDRGTISYFSYWWTQKNPQKVQKLTAYQWIEIGHARWVVASNYDFNERNGNLLQENLIIMGLFAILLAILFLIVFNLRNYNRRYQTYLENRRLQEARQIELERYTIEKSLLQESKLETVGLLTTTIVHDMNNFLTPLIGNVQLLMEERADDAELVAELKEIYDSAKKGQRLSTNVLRFSKVNAGEKDDLDITDVVEDAINTMEILAPKTVHLQFAYKRVGKAYFEKDDLQVLLYNLLTNAYQSTDKKAEILVSVSKADQKMQKQYQEHSYVYSKKEFAMIQVKDNGPGIPKEIEDKIFTPFFTTKTTDGGTGLGLFIVVSLIKKNDWLLDLESSDKGTTFTIGIPLSEES